MALKYQVETLDGIDESQKSFYKQTENGYVLDVEGVDTGEELKGALNKEREANKEAAKRLKELEKQREDAEREAMTQQGKFEELSKADRAAKIEAEKKLAELELEIGKSKADMMVSKLASSLTADQTEQEIIGRFAADFIKIEGREASFDKPEDELKESLSRFVRSKASGGNDGGGGKGGGEGVTMSREAFDAMPPSKKTEFFRNGGKLKD